MEPIRPAFMAPNLTELPHSLILDFTAELQPLRNLIVECHPLYVDRDLEKTVKKMLLAITHKSDIEYQLAEFSMQAIEEFFNPYQYCYDQAKLSEVQQIFIMVGRNIYNKINSMSGYVSGIFPYTYAGIRYNSEVLLRNVTHLNYDIELAQKPFHFTT